MSRYFLFLLSFVLPAVCNAQMWERLGIDTLCHKEEGLSIKVDALSFFRDNEYDNDIVEGYSLPGTWIRPTLNYNPLKDIHIEVGASALFFHGANRYPCYAYNDIGTWKGNQYQQGAHLLPWVRARIDSGKWSFVLGDIYGAQNHGFISPLYNDEQLLSADPEAGLQILHNGNHLYLDTYLNWQSYQFELDTHQEAFTVGIVTDYKLNNCLNALLQIQAQHRGGEQDATSYGVQTLWNATAGIRYAKEFHGSAIKLIGVEAEAIGCLQQAGSLWPFDKGFALHSAFTTKITDDFDFKIGTFVAPKHFVSLYGNPMFSTITLKGEATYHPNGTRYYGNHFNGITTAYLHFGYSHTWAESYTLGTNLEVLHYNHGGNEQLQLQKGSATPFSFGIYFRFAPEFKI